jgi:hypothetical protein
MGNLEKLRDRESDTGRSAGLKKGRCESTEIASGSTQADQAERLRSKVQLAQSTPGNIVYKNTLIKLARPQNLGFC